MRISDASVVETSVGRTRNPSPLEAEVGTR